MAMQPQLWTKNGLSVELGINAPKLGRLMAGLQPYKKGEQGEELFLMAEVVEHLLNGGDGDKGKLVATQEDARHKKVQADIKELDLAQRRGEIVEIETVKETLAGIVISVRAKLLGIPKKAAVLLIGEKKPTVIQEKLTKLVNECLEELTGLKPEKLEKKISTKQSVDRTAE